MRWHGFCQVVSFSGERTKQSPARGFGRERASSLTSFMPPHPSPYPPGSEPRIVVLDQCQQQAVRGLRGLSPLPVAQAVHRPYEPLLASATAVKGSTRGNRKRRSNYKIEHRPTTPTIRHPLVMSSPADILRHHLAAVTLSCGLFAISGILAWLVGQMLGAAISLAAMLGIYQSLFVVRVMAAYRDARGNFYFVNRPKFYRLLLFSMLVFAPHTLAYTIFRSIG